MKASASPVTERSTFSETAVIIPCHNEELTVPSVVRSFKSALPGCVVFVADNNSTDQTAAAAREAGALVITESRKGKGFAVRRLMADVDADCYVMVDGDGTYDPSVASRMVSLVLDQGIDMVNGERMPVSGSDAVYRRGHRFGNRALTWIFQKLFGLPLRDTLSGYRAMSRRFVKSFPTGATGFEIEAELNAHAAVLGVPVAELLGHYFERAEGSESKLSTYRDGLRITRRNLRLFRDARPGLAFLILGTPWILLSIVLIGIPFVEYLDTGLVRRFPSLIAGTACLILAVLLMISGMIMDRIARNRVEATRLAYLGYRGPTAQLNARTTRLADMDGGKPRGGLSCGASSGNPGD